MDRKLTETIDVVVTGVTWPKEEFSDGEPHRIIFRTKTVACLGELSFWPKPGMALRLTGSYSVWNGVKQFKFIRVCHDTPVDQAELLRYCAELSKGVGPATVDKILEMYGNDWQKNLDQMAPKIALPLKRTLDMLMSDKAKTEVVTYLLKKGGTIRMANEAFKKWGANTISTIEANPYILATLPGVGFKTVDDRLRAQFGIPDRDVRRALAAVDYSMTAILEESGNSIVDRDALYGAIKELNVPVDLAQDALAKLVLKGRIVFVGLDKVTSKTVIDHEGDIARYIVEHQAEAPEKFDRSLLEDGFSPDDSQLEAIQSAVENLGLTIINGGAGCGKTTIIKQIVRQLEKRGCHVDLCAFAGKAAARMREATGHHASTIHSLLGWCGEGGGFALGNLHGASVILDEASMVPSSLIFEITTRNPERLILVGDQAQLQPVGIGSPFHDLIDGLKRNVHTVTTCYRNKEAIFKSAYLIRNGGVPMSAKSERETFQIERHRTADDIHEAILELVRSGEIDFEQDLVLTPRNGEGEAPAPCTVKSLNADIQAIVNPHEPRQKFKVGDRVMCTKNVAALDMWNGTTGWIDKVDIDGKPYFRNDENGRTERIGEKEVLDKIVPAYCLTVHKSQGSQYRRVYIVSLRRDENRLFDRSMLYTAVTRAKEGCYVLTDDGLSRVIQSVKRRVTYLQMMMKGDVE